MRTSDVTSFSDARDHLREKFDQAKKTGRAVVVTNHGKVDGVILSPTRYDELTEAEQLIASLKQLDNSMKDVRAGRTRPMRDALLRIADEIGVELNP